MNTNITKEAEYIIKRDFVNKNIAFIGEYLSHDGYDRFGPKSNLWDLFIVEECTDNFYFYDYHWENWYTEFDKKEYELFKKKNLENCSFDELNKILYENEKISEKLNNTVRNLCNTKVESCKK